MAHELSCPSCGERDELRGAAAGDDIRVTCLCCRAVWMRGAPRCATCGGEEIVTRPQAMTRHSRGTQLSIIGWRQVPLCRTCDADALARSVGENVPVPAEHVSACLHAPGTGAGPAPAAPAAGEGRRAAAEAPPAAGPPDPEPRTAPSPAGERAERARPAGPASASGSGPGTGPGAGAASGRPARPAPSGRRPGAAAGERRAAGGGVPTVRQAVTAFLADASGEVDATAMLLLGTHLGSYNRLDVLDAPGAADELAAWFTARWGDRDGAAGARARLAVCRAVDFWGAHGWLSTDPAAGLR